MIWLQFLATALVIVFAGVRLARYGDVLGEKTGLRLSWAGVVLVAATTSLPELLTVAKLSEKGPTSELGRPRLQNVSKTGEDIRGLERSRADEPSCLTCWESNPYRQKSRAVTS
jgi:hypothetical protein